MFNIITVDDTIIKAIVFIFSFLVDLKFNMIWGFTLIFNYLFVLKCMNLGFKFHVPCHILINFAFLLNI